MRPRWKTAATFALPCIVLMFLAYHFRPRHAGASPSKAALPVSVRLVQAGRKPMESAVNAIATVQAFNTVSVHVQVEGVLERVLFTEGALVRRNEVLALLDRRPFEVQLRVAQAQRAKDVAQRDNVRRDVARYEFLVRNDSAPTQTLDATRAQLAQLEAALAGDQAQIDQARLQLNYTVIRAPIAGRVGARLIDAGNVVHPADANPLATLTQVHPVAISFAVPQAMLAPLRQQQQAHTLEVQARDASGAATLATGELRFIDTQVDAATGTLRCKAVFANDGEVLWPGMFVTAHIVLARLPDAVVVPSRALLAGAQPAVYVVGADGRAARRAVTVEAVTADESALSGIAPGQQVVVDGQFALEDGMLVRAEVSGPAPPAPQP